MAGAGLKRLPPDKYDGFTDFERFAKLLKAYMGCENNDYCDMLDAGAKKADTIYCRSHHGTRNGLSPKMTIARRVQTTQLTTVLRARIPH